MQAKELALHAEVQVTMKYTYIGLDDQAAALAGLPLPKLSTNVDGSGIGRDSGGVLRQELTPAGTDAGAGEGPGNDETPSGEGVSSHPVTACQGVAVDVRSGGGGNCTREPDSASPSHFCICGNPQSRWPEMGREQAAHPQELLEVIEKWPLLPSPIVQATLALVRTAAP